MTRYREIAWPWAAFLVGAALIAQGVVTRWLADQPLLLRNAWQIGVLALTAASFVLLVMPRRRIAFLLGAAVCAALMGYALYAQHVLNLEPCPLCIFQRIAMIAAGAIFLVGAIHNPGRFGATIYAVLAFFAAAGGAGVAMRHVWLQSLPPSEVPACGPGLNYMVETLPFTEMLAKVFQGSGECAAADWSVLGVSMPGWTLVFFIALMVGALASIDRD